MTNFNITCIASGPVITDRIISVVDRLKLSYKLSLYIREYFPEYELPIISHYNFESGLIEIFKYFINESYSGKDSSKHREYIRKFKEDIPKIEDAFNDLIIKGFSEQYHSGDYIPIPKCEIKYKCSKRRIEVITIRLYYKTKYTYFYNTDNPNGIDFGGSDWKYNVTDILNIILTSHDTDSLTPKGIEEYRNFR